MYYANGFIEYKGYSIEIEWDDLFCCYMGTIHGIVEGSWEVADVDYYVLLKDIEKMIDEYEQNK